MKVWILFTSISCFVMTLLVSTLPIKKTNCTFKHIYKYVLAPNYNIPEIPEALQEEYTILTYKDLHEYLIDNEVRKEWCEDTNFSAFVEAIRKHTYAYIGDYLRNEMEEIFMRKMSGSC